MVNSLIKYELSANSLPTIYVADKLKLVNFPYFEASEKERADVDMGSLLK